MCYDSPNSGKLVSTKFLGALEISDFDQTATTCAFADKAEPREQVLLLATVLVKFWTQQIVRILDTCEHLNLPRSALIANKIGSFPFASIAGRNAANFRVVAVDCRIE